MPNTANGHKNVIHYVRVSTNEQAESGFSIPDQRRALAAYSERVGHKVRDVIIDDGYSSRTTNRPGWNRVVEMVKAGGIDEVWVIKRNRLFRSRLLRLQTDMEFKKYGTALRALDDTGNRFGDAMIDEFSEWYLEEVVENTARGRRQAARQGKIVLGGTPPYGFRHDGNGGYLVDEDRMPVIRRIFRMVGEEGYSLNRVRHTLEEDGVPTNLGAKSWRITTLKRTITNDAYKPHTFDEVKALVSPEVAQTLDPNESYGISWYGRKSKLSDEGPIAVPIPDAGIPRETVEGARKAVAENVRHSRADNRFWALSGRAFCPCGRRLACRATKRHGKTYYYYYLCPRYREHTSYCEHGKRHPAQALETRVFWTVWEMVSDPKNIEAQIRAYLEKERAALEHQDANIRSTTAMLEKIAKERRRYQEMYAEEAMTLDELKDALARLEARKEKAEAELERLSNAKERIEFLDALCSQSGLNLAAIAYVRAGRSDDELLMDLYRDLDLKIVVEKDGSVEISGIFGVQKVSCPEERERAKASTSSVIGMTS